MSPSHNRQLLYVSASRHLKGDAKRRIFKHIIRDHRNGLLSSVLDGEDTKIGAAHASVHVTGVNTFNKFMNRMTIKALSWLAAHCTEPTGSTTPCFDTIERSITGEGTPGEVGLHKSCAAYDEKEFVSLTADRLKTLSTTGEYEGIRLMSKPPHMIDVLAILHDRFKEAGHEASYKDVAKHLIANTIGLTEVMQTTITGAGELMDDQVSVAGFSERALKTARANSAAEAQAASIPLPGEAAEASEDGVSVPVSAPAIDINEAMAKAVNALLGPATGGKLVDITAVVKQLNEKDDVIARLTKEHSELAMKVGSMRAAPAVTSGTTAVNGAELTFEVVVKKADDVFRTLGGAKIAGLNFDVTTLVWKDKAGNVVNHPWAPPIDEDYSFEAKSLLKVLAAIALRRNVWLHGHTGSGKTTLPDQIAARLGFPVIGVNLDRDIERGDFVGKDILKQESGATVSEFRPGILPTALSMPCFLVLNEFDAGRPDIMFVLQSTLEGKGLMLTEDGGRIVQQHPLCNIFATANTRGQGDEYGIYAGTRPMNASTLDRFAAFVEISYMSKDREATMLGRRFPGMPKEMLKKLTLFSSELRKAFINGEIIMSLSPRALISTCEMYTFMSGFMDSEAALTTAVEAGILDKATADNRVRVSELRARCM